MIALILLFFAGREFYRLAEKHDKNKWLFAILGVVSYYASLVIGQLIMGVVIGLTMEELPDDSTLTIYGLLAIPIGVLGCWGLYRLLKSSWEKQAVLDPHMDVIDSGMQDDASEF